MTEIKLNTTKKHRTELPYYETIPPWKNVVMNEKVIIRDFGNDNFLYYAYIKQVFSLPIDRVSEHYTYLDSQCNREIYSYIMTSRYKCAATDLVQIILIVPELHISTPEDVTNQIIKHFGAC